MLCHYQINWFYFAVALLTLLGACILHCFRNRVFTVHAAVLKERNRFAREIHDTLGQRLAAIATQLDVIRDELDDDPRAARFHVDQARALAREGIEEARRSIWALRPCLLDESDLAGAVTRLAIQLTSGTPVTAETTIRGTPATLPEEAEINLLRVAQEALINAIKHAGARRIRVQIASTSTQIQLDVSDDGHGLDPGAIRPNGNTGLGLRSMGQRIGELGGRITVKSRRGEGTEISITVPLPVISSAPVRSLWSTLRALGSTS